MNEFLSNLGLAPELVVFISSMLPIVELRGAIPIGIAADIPWYWTYLIAVAGNILPVPFILKLLNWAIGILSKIGIFKKFFDWLFEHTKNNTEVVQKYKEIGLTLFVAVPLPVTGAWTASVAALMFGFEPKKAFICITLGVMIAGVIVTVLSLLGWIGAVIAGVALSALAITYIWKSHKKKVAKLDE